MKKISLLLFIIILGYCAQAQDAFSIGLKGGYNTHQLTDNMDSIQSSVKNSFQIGAFIRVGKRIYLQPEANYQVDESTLSKSIGSIVMNQDVTIKALKVPVLLGVKLIRKKDFNLRIMAGPAVTFNLDKKLDPATMSDLWPIKSVDDLKNSMWSAQVGAGMDIFFVTLDVRYEMGIDNMYNGNSNLQMKNNIFNVSLGIKLF